MSPLWRDELGAYLAPHRVCLVQLRRGVRASIGREEDVEVAATQIDWAAALGALEQRLGEVAWRAARLRVVLCDHWVRYAMLPWQNRLSAAERLAHARELLASLYGDALHDWVVTLADAPPGSARVACAMPAVLLESLRALAQRANMDLMSVQPQLIAAYNCWQHRLPAAPAWFVTVEQGSLAAARIGHDGIERVHSVRIGHDWMREIRRLQTFGRLVSGGAETGSVYVDAPRSWCALAGETGSLEWLEDEALPLTTLHRLAQRRRLAA